MKSRRISLFVGWSLVALVGCGTQANLSEEATERPEMSQGAFIYQENCAGCHGDDGRGGESKECMDLVTPHIEKQSNGQLYAFIAFGTGGSMPSFSDLLEQDEIIDVIEHLRDLNMVETAE